MEDYAARHWWPSIHQQCLLNLALIHLGYPGGERRCQEQITSDDISSASRCLELIKSNKELMDSIDRRTKIHLIRTEGDLYFRQKMFPQAIDKLNEAKRFANKNGFRIDVKYCDDRLNVVQALANKVPHSAPCSPTGSTAESAHRGYEADVSSNAESSDDEGLRSTFRTQLSDEEVFAAMCNVSKCLPARECEN